MRLLPVLVTTACCLWSNAHADDPAAEIDYLLTAVGSSHCVFIRNGKRYSAADAEEHLRMKYSRGKRYAPTAEAFIERLASRSSMSTKPYSIDCPGEEGMPSGRWLAEKLAAYRKARSGGPRKPELWLP